MKREGDIYIHSLECKKSGRAQLVRSTCSLEMLNGHCARCAIPIAAILQLEKLASVYDHLHNF